MHRTRIRAMLTAVLLVLASTALAACGDDDGDTSASQEANATDRAFAAEMIGHHQAAVEMAEAARKNASREEITELADAIITTQNAEIAQMKTAEQRLADAGVDERDLGMTEAEMGMDMDMDMLMSTEGFDRMFIDMMIPHHQGAIRMARMELADGQDPELRKLAEAIIAAQSKEIEEMNAWREDWYGEPSPAGGVPDEAMGSHMSDEEQEHGMDHSG